MMLCDGVAIWNHNKVSYRFGFVVLWKPGLLWLRLHPCNTGVLRQCDDAYPQHFKFWQQTAPGP